MHVKQRLVACRQIKTLGHGNGVCTLYGRLADISKLHPREPLVSLTCIAGGIS